MRNDANNVAAQAGDEPMREAPKLTKDMIEAIRSIIGTPDVDGIPQPYAGAIVLLETFASIGMTAKRDGKPTPNSLLCTKFANDLREVAQVSPRATADLERDAARYRWLTQELGGSISMDLDLDCISEIDSHIDAARLATTKPGA